MITAYTKSARDDEQAYDAEKRQRDALVKLLDKIARGRHAILAFVLHRGLLLLLRGRVSRVLALQLLSGVGGPEGRGELLVAGAGGAV